MDSCLFVLLNFWIGFFSNIMLNLLSTPKGQKYFKSPLLISLQPYFTKRGSFQAAIDAGVALIIIVIIAMFISNLFLLQIFLLKIIIFLMET